MKTAQEYQKRLQRHLDELKWLYCELYPGREDMFTQLCEQMEAWYQERPESEKEAGPGARTGACMVQPPRYAWHDAVYRRFCRQFEGV